MMELQLEAALVSEAVRVVAAATRTVGGSLFPAPQLCRDEVTWKQGQALRDAMIQVSWWRFVV